ncbi:MULTISPECIES: type IV pilus twitching motility protein PilT [Ruminococcus]|uniref:Pilus retraction protein PilT n=1 Tax=Ruminococcus champanellensis (strain DSM 18848 / JCM 17042 / KCTC 15320 / 18P13) TaxID=213810 RepID=D4LAF4_RUMC1|nr:MULTISPECIES: type IV pilus twitching motility protein PilT [Ruminococcus]MED9891632.1 type IV pilus twitching motility protein PilT [Ruminococcus champanellensis]CBL16599.1 pilus retraction protein PilT [Ruminococcus champanellensis 18P13 = JCM 17042]CDD54173.1 pilus retraction protein PilT [Ruminococcus sp. CAG:379]
MAILINKILDEVRVLGCSDLHFTNGINPVVRLNGQLRKMSGYEEMNEEGILEIVEQMTNEQQRRSIAQHKDTDFSFTTRSGYRHRVNVFFQRGFTAIAIRLLRNDIPTLEDLFLPPILGEFAMRPRGLVLVTGPTGSGKSTTLAGMIDYINVSRSAHVITIEDPIEYVHEHKRCMVNQREVGMDVPDFASALRAALREDPDVILVGEMRDFETVSAAVTAAETGHLVLSTLHTTSAPDTINRIIDVYPEHQQVQIRTQLANTLVGVISQTLLPKRDGSGRIAAMEILNVTDACAAMIRDNKVHLIQSAIQTGKQNGMMCLDQELARMAKQGIVYEADALERCQDKAEFYRYFNAM